MKHAIAANLALAICLVTPSASLAQQRSPSQGFVSLNVAIQDGPQRLSLAVPVEVFESQGELLIDDGVIGGYAMDVGGGVRGRRFAFGAGFWRSSTTGSHDLTASTIPASRGSFTRSVNGITPGLEHTEQAVYIFAGLTRTVTDHFDLMVSGGPAFFSLKQGVPTDITITERPTVIQHVGTGTVEDTAIGLQLALDLNYMFHPKLGIGGLVRYSWGSVDLPNAAESMTLGGIQVGAGIRARF